MSVSHPGGDPNANLYAQLKRDVLDRLPQITAVESVPDDIKAKQLRSIFDLARLDPLTGPDSPELIVGWYRQNPDDWFRINYTDPNTCILEDLSAAAEINVDPPKHDYLALHGVWQGDGYDSCSRVRYTVAPSYLDNSEDMVRERFSHIEAGGLGDMATEDLKKVDPITNDGSLLSTETIFLIHKLLLSNGARR